MFKKHGMTNNTAEEPRSWSPRSWSGRAMVLTVLGAITLGVAGLSIHVSYSILIPTFGAWSAPTVGALDALWVVLQATEILAANNRRRVRRVQWAGGALTLVIAAIPTADLTVNHTSGTGFDLAVVLAPVAIVLTKATWWVILPALGRRVSPATRQAIADRRQEVADRLEQMEADAADQIELLAVAQNLGKRVAKAETRYRKGALKEQKTLTEKLHRQATATTETITEKPLPALVADIELPELATWTPTALALPVTPALPGRHTLGTQVSDPDDDAEADAAHHVQLLVTVAEIAAVTGVPTPVPGEELTADQTGVVLRALRYSQDPPMSYRKAGTAYRKAGFKGSEHKIRRIWRELKDEAGEPDTEDMEDNEEAEDPEGAR